jgi:hypothetical protein
MPYTFDAAATAQFEEYLDTAESLGLYVQYDMRNSFLNLPSVDYQVKYLRNRSNILNWYTGDEPDGADYDLNSTQLAYEKIYAVDGYHPVSLVLNCENYYFIEYGLNGADVLMVDPYPIAMNGRWSKPYNTYVDQNFGDSGCDNCNGTFYDISTRIESSRNRARLQGAWRTKPVWIVPQSFNDGQQEFWFRVPFGSEGEAVTTILSTNHGGQGHASWNSQYSSQDLLNVAFLSLLGVLPLTSAERIFRRKRALRPDAFPNRRLRQPSRDLHQSLLPRYQRVRRLLLDDPQLQQHWGGRGPRPGREPKLWPQRCWSRLEGDIPTRQLQWDREGAVVWECDEDAGWPAAVLHAEDECGGGHLGEVGRTV